MAFGNSFTSYDALLKEYYSDDALENEIFSENPFLGLVPKMEKQTGRHFVQPLVYSAGQGRSASFSTAQSMASLTGELAVDFLLTRAENHAVANVSSQTIAATQNDKGAFMEAVTLISDNQLQNLTNEIADSLFRGTSRARGQIASSVSLSGSTISFVNPKDVLRFSVGMALDVAAAETSGNVRAYGSAGHGLYVSAVDYANATISIGTTPTPGATACPLNDSTNGIPTIATGDYIFAVGDRNNGLAGFGAWIPYGGVASNDSFFGVNRSANPVMLAGNWLNGQGGTTEEVLEQALAQVGEVGGNLTHFLMPFKKFADLAKSLGSKAQIVDSKVSPQIGYKGIEVVGPRGTVTCIPDRNCPSTMIAGVNVKDWQLNSIGKIVHVWDEDGKVWLRSASDSGMEIRFYSLGQLVCKAPRNQINIQVSA